MFLCRYHQERGEAGGDKFNIEVAKYFVWKNQVLTELYKQAAPYIIAFYYAISRGLQHIRSPDELVSLVERFASSQRRLEGTIGRAAHVANVLQKTKVRNVRMHDFREVVRRPFVVAPFDKDELTIIESYDPKGPILGNSKRTPMVRARRLKGNPKSPEHLP